MHGQGTHTVFVDANILYSRTLRDWFFLIGMSELGEVYRARWSEDGLVEALYHLRRDHPDWPSTQIEDVRAKLEANFGECKVTGFDMDPAYDGPDPNDKHIHSAAIACEADIILTNDAEFSAWWQVNSDHSPYEVQDPDYFFCLTDDSVPDIVEDVVREQGRYWAKRHGEARLVESLHSAGVPEFSERVARHIQRIALRG